MWKVNGGRTLQSARPGLGMEHCPQAGVALPPLVHDDQCPTPSRGRCCDWRGVGHVNLSRGSGRGCGLRPKSEAGAVILRTYRECGDVRMGNPHPARAIRLRWVASTTNNSASIWRGWSVFAHLMSTLRAQNREREEEDKELLRSMLLSTIPDSRFGVGVRVNGTGVATVGIVRSRQTIGRWVVPCSPTGGGWETP